MPHPTQDSSARCPQREQLGGRDCQQSLFEPWLAWRQLPEDVRQHALDVMTAFYLETVHEQNLESKTDVRQA